MEQVVDQYLNHLRLDRELPSLNYLQRLIQHHLAQVPYESFSKFHYYSIAPDYIPPLPVFVQNLVEKGWGGTCFSLNMNFARLLTELGFATSLVRVEPGHLAVMIEMNDRRLYADVGYGSPIMKPLELAAKSRHIMHGFGEEIIFTKLTADTYEIDRRANGKTFVKKTIDWSPLTEEDIKEDIRLSYIDSDENITMRRVTAVKFNGHQCFYLRDRTMKVMTFRNIREMNMNDFTKWTQLVQDVYQIEPEILFESLRFLEERGIKLF